jgi:glycosyltransferase involved in cell wall biosynthesis
MRESLLQVASFSPRRMVYPNSWCGHIPFASWLVKELNPAIIVELGTHTGNSYFALCQTVANNGLNSKCYAVDHWEGDKHAGFYGDDIYSDVNKYNEDNYASFSKLLRTSFDEAVHNFEDASVDLLHIDGLHTYEDVKNDFLTWLPKLSKRAIVIFHDTYVFHGDFGVWKFWSEITKDYPLNINFPHSHGLGVLKVGTEPLDENLERIFLDNALKDHVINYFVSLGQNTINYSEKSQEVLNVALDRDHKISAINQAVAERDNEIVSLSQAVAERDNEIVSLGQAVAQRDHELHKVLTSRSWLITKPMRVASKFLIHKPYRFVRKLMSDLSRKIWRYIPLTIAQKHKLKSAAFKLLPIFFRRTVVYRNWLNGEGSARNSTGLVLYYEVSTNERTVGLSPAFKSFLKYIWAHMPLTIKIKQKIKIKLFSWFPSVFTHNNAYHNLFTMLDLSTNVQKDLRSSGSDGGWPDKNPSKTDDLLLDKLKTEFDENFYLTMYPDLAKAKVDPLQHFFKYGQKEGRIAKLHISQNRELDPKKKTVLVVSHDASRTGAPILAWNICQQLKEEYNIVALFIGGGNIRSFFEDICNASVGPFNPDHMPGVISKLCQHYHINFALVNSLESRSVLRTLAESNIPSVLMIHEFPYTNIYTSEDYSSALFWAGRTVFPVKMVQDAAYAILPIQNKKLIESTLVLNQGKSIIPINGFSAEKNESTVDDIKQKIYGSFDSKPFVILGAGTVQSRKGVDLFFDVAEELRKIAPESHIVMVWIGHQDDKNYYDSIKNKIKDAGLEKSCYLFDSIENLEDIYGIVDLFFMSSRQDPLPNVAIDSMHNGIPVVCFSNTTGIEEFLLMDESTKDCVVPHLDIKMAAIKILEIYNSLNYRTLLSKSVKNLSAAHFDMTKYVAKLLNIVDEVSREMEIDKKDYETLLNSDDFTKDYFLPSHQSELSRESSILLYIKSQRKYFSYTRKASPSFNEGAYIKLHGLSNTSGNPLADYIRSGYPQGPWCDNLIDPSQMPPETLSNLTCALHIHAYYPDLIDDVLTRLKLNNFACDLFINTSSKRDNKKVSKILSSYDRGACIIRTTPNIGRNFGPLFTEFSEDLMKYDVIGHVHTKKSEALLKESQDSLQAVELIEKWRNFLLENLVGGIYPSAMHILKSFENNPNLGLVFAADPNIVGWTENRPVADELAERMKISPLPSDIFSFPVGSMFWARPKALQPLFDLNMTWEDYPAEPLPYDGSMLHAIERLLPIVAQSQGYEYSVIYTPGVNR